MYRVPPVVTVIGFEALTPTVGRGAFKGRSASFAASCSGLTRRVPPVVGLGGLILVPAADVACWELKTRVAFVAIAGLGGLTTCAPANVVVVPDPCSCR